MALGATIPPAQATDSIRVALVERAASAELRGVDIAVRDLVGCACTPPAMARLHAVHATVAGSGIEIDGHRAPRFRLLSEHPILFNGRQYPAPIDLVRNGEGLAVVDELPLEEYVVGVLRAETPEQWPLQALRAQAIVARTYAAYQRTLATGKPYHIVASTVHQQFFGHVPATSPAWTAVRVTAGQVLRWQGELFPAFYHAESGGYTEDPRTVFAAANMPALKPVRCEFSAGSPHFSWTLDLRLGDLGEVLRRNDVVIGRLAAVEVTERTPSLRAAVVTVRGSQGAARLRGNDFRRMLGYDTLKSTLFAVAVDDGWAHFSGRGYGHGAGLCQWGAKGMAEQGYTAERILEFYYPGTVLGVLAGP